MELGILKSVPARQKWTSESREFTPWLAENINHLNAAIGLELEVENIEVAVGPYSADILARDTGTGKYVVIENQLEKTNHDHLGKSITYASVLDASAIIWIATQLTEEHKKALDWLNDHTTDEISFYGVHIELWQIDESKPALKFNVISSPSEAIRQAAKSKATEELSEGRKKHLDFWTKFADKLIKIKQIPSVQTPKPRHWFDVSLGKSGIHISNICNTWDNKVSIRVYISNRIADSMLPYLESHKEQIEKEIGHALDWNPNPENRDKVLSLSHPIDFNDPRKIDEAVDWLVDKTVKFRQTFTKYIRKASTSD